MWRWNRSCHRGQCSMVPFQSSIRGCQKLSRINLISKPNWSVQGSVGVIMGRLIHFKSVGLLFAWFLQASLWMSTKPVSLANRNLTNLGTWSLHIPWNGVEARSWKRTARNILSHQNPWRKTPIREMNEDPFYLRVPMRVTRTPVRQERFLWCATRMCT